MSGSANLKGIFSQKLKENKFLQAGTGEDNVSARQLLGGGAFKQVRTTGEGGVTTGTKSVQMTPEEIKAKLAEIYERGYESETGMSTKDAFGKKAEEMAKQRKKEGIEKYTQKMKSAAGIEDKQTYEDRVHEIKYKDEQIKEAKTPEEKKQLEDEKATLIKDKEVQDKRRAAFMKSPEVAQRAMGITDLNEQLKGMFEGDIEKKKNALDGKIEQQEFMKREGLAEGGQGWDPEQEAKLEALKKQRAGVGSEEDRAARAKSAGGAIKDWQAMGSKEKAAAEARGLTTSEKYGKAATERQALMAEQQKAVGGDKQLEAAQAAQQHAIMGTKGVDYRAGVGAEGFDKVITEKFGEDVAKRIQTRREMLKTGHIGGPDENGLQRVLNDKERAQVQAAQQREVQGLYQRGEGMQEGGLNEMLRLSIIAGFEAAAAKAEAVKQNGETPADETGQTAGQAGDKTPGEEGGKKPGEETGGEAVATAKVDGNVAHTVVVSGTLQSDKMSAEISKEIMAVMGDAFAALPNDIGKKALAAAMAKKAAGKEPGNNGGKGSNLYNNEAAAANAH